MTTHLLDLVRLVVSVTLLLAGAAKLLSPHPLAAGLGRVFAVIRSRPGSATLLVRVIAGVEIVTAMLIAASWLMPVGPVLAAAVGLGIVAFAAVAIGRDRRAPCGCFGESNGKPVGLSNVSAGLALAAGSVAVLVAHPPAAPSYDGAGGLTLTSAVTLATVLVVHRSRLIGPFARHFRSFARLREAAEFRG